ncbi:methyl-accepting chemotaxis protein [Bacillota bacterium Lsc_1132]
MKLKLGSKINLIVISIILLMSLAIGLAVNWQVKTNMKKYATEKAKGDLNLAFHYIDAKYRGDWTIRNGELYKGSHRLNGNEEIVDAIAKDTGDTVTIFQKDKRITTNVIVKGKRAVGTKVSAKVANAVLHDGQSFYGEANVAGYNYQTAYMPIKDANGKIIGIFYVGASQKNIDQMFASFLKVFLLVLAGAIILAIVIPLVFTYRLKKRLDTVSSAMDRAGAGDFTTKIKDQAGDELTDLANNYNQMAQNLHMLIREVSQAAEQVAASSQELTAGAEQTSRASAQITEAIQQIAIGAENQTNTVEANGQAFNEISFGINRIAQSSATVSEKAVTATDAAQEGGDLVGKTVKQMDAIQYSVEESGNVIQLLDKRSKEIGEITRVINEIANQTNLLALNAAIEAARAGEHGKGFAVVADEVRKLAEESQKSSAQISSLIKDIQEDMKLSHSTMDRVKEEVQSGIQIVDRAEEKFGEIHELMEAVQEEINEVAATAEQMSAGAEEVTSSTRDIIVVSKETSLHSQNAAASTEEQLASMEEITASATSLSTMAIHLQELMAKFKI